MDHHRNDGGVKIEVKWRIILYAYYILPKCYKGTFPSPNHVHVHICNCDSDHVLVCIVIIIIVVVIIVIVIIIIIRIDHVHCQGGWKDGI